MIYLRIFLFIQTHVLRGLSYSVYGLGILVLSDGDNTIRAQETVEVHGSVLLVLYHSRTRRLI